MGYRPRMTARGDSFEQKLLRALGVDLPALSPSPGERHLLVLVWPTFHLRLLIELTDLGDTHELSVMVIGDAEEMSARLLDPSWSEARATARDTPPALPWCRGELEAASLAQLRAHLDAFEAVRWPADELAGRDGIHIVFWLRDGRGRQELQWSTATHVSDGAPFDLAVELLELAASSAPPARAAIGDARTYLRRARTASHT